MDSQLHIGERLGSLTTISARQSERLDDHDKRISKLEDFIYLAKRAGIVVTLWGSGLATAANSPEIGKSLAHLAKDILTHLLTTS